MDRLSQQQSGFPQGVEQFPFHSPPKNKVLSVPRNSIL